MQAKEKIVYYTELDESVKEPLAVIEEFCDWSDKETVKRIMCHLLLVARHPPYVFKAWKFVNWHTSQLRPRKGRTSCSVIP